MDFFSSLFRKPPYPAEQRQEVERLINDLIRIGKTDDFLSERPGGGFNLQNRHIQTREIGQRLFAIGGVPLMEHAQGKVRKSLGENLASHLAYAWADIGTWVP